MFKRLFPVLFVFVLGACAGQDMDDGKSAAMASDQTIVDIAAGDDRFSTLVTAVKEAGLAGTLSSKGPFTVFAPTNAAFDKLPDGTLESLLKPENKDQLTSILTYHVVPGRVMAGDIAGKSLRADTVNGQKLPIDATGSSVSAGNATVVATDVVASNGVIHVVDEVILPQ